MWELLKASLGPPFLFLHSLHKLVQPCLLLQISSTCQYLQIHLYTRPVSALMLKSSYVFNISTCMSPIPSMPQTKLMIFAPPPNSFSSRLSYLPHFPLYKSGIYKSSLELLSLSLSSAYTSASPAGFAC